MYVLPDCEGEPFRVEESEVCYQDRYLGGSYYFECELYRYGNKTEHDTTSDGYMSIIGILIVLFLFIGILSGYLIYRIRQKARSPVKTELLSSA